nr:ribonuclease H-like domain-containing protein [Tanacetum cinerariifolium]
MALPEDHLAKFHMMADAKEMWEAIKSRFGEGLHKWFDRFQTLLSQLEIHGAVVLHEDVNQKFLRSLPSSWSQLALIMRTKPGLDTLSFDDLYNKLRVFEHDVKGTTASSSSSNIQNVAFVYADNTSNTNDINDDDMEEMDLKWQVAMISMRIKKFHKRTGRKLLFDTKDPVGFDKTNDDSQPLVTIDGEDINWPGHVEEDVQNYAMMAYSSSNSGFDIKSVFMSKASDLEDTPINDRYTDGMHTIPPPTRNYVPSGPDVEIDYSKFTYGPKQTLVDESDAKTNKYTSCESDSSVETTTSMPAPVEQAPKVVCKPKVWTDAPIIEEYESDSDDDLVLNENWDTAVKVLAGCNWRNKINSWNKVFKYTSGSRFRKSVKDPLGRLRSNNGKKFKNNDLIEFHRLKRIKKEYSNARTPQQNGVAERKNMTPIEAAGTMVLVTKPQNKTPYELLTGKQPIISYLRPFGCHVTILNTINHLSKFDGKSDSGFLVGYSLNSKAFRVYNLKTKRVEENLHVNFLENKPNVARKGHAWMFDLDYLTNSMNYKPVSVENQANKSTGLKEANNSVGDKIEKTTDFKSYEKPVSQVEQIFLEELEKIKRQENEANDAVRKETTHENQDANTNLLNAISTPLSTAGPSRAFTNGEPSYLDNPSMPHLEDIYASPSKGIFTDSSYDDEGVVTDFNNLEITMNVSLTPTTRIHTIHPKTQILGDPMLAIQTRSKVYKNKKDERGVVVRNKVRLVAQGHRQKEGIDYDEVFALVARIKGIRIFLAFASYMGFIVYQMDVKSAFLYGTIDEEVYVTQPLSFVDLEFPNKVYKVVKALYGLHQAPRTWYATLSTFLEKSRYRRGAIDKTLFIKQDKRISC